MVELSVKAAMVCLYTKLDFLLRMMAMTEKAKNGISRRQAIKYIGGGILGIAGLTYGLKRSDLLAFLQRDAETAEKTEPLPVDKRVYKTTGDKLSLLGFGAMRFPTSKYVPQKIDEELAEKMIDYAYRRGVNYFDTAYIYHGGTSEVFLGKALKKYPRDSFYLADKMPTFKVQNLDDAKRIFDEQLRRCQVDYFDNYLLHALSKKEDFTRVYLDNGVLNYLRAEKASGRIKQLGFSFHGDVPFFKYLVDNYTWDFAMIQLNYLDWDEPDEILPSDERAKISGSMYRLLAAKNIPCFVMEPVKGGQLASLTPPAVKILKEAEPNRSTASWAMRYAATLPNVVTVLSGMSDLNQVVDNINTMTDFKPLTQADYKVLANAKAAFQKNQKLACTDCKYCMPCPYGVNIAGIFQVYNKCAVGLGIPDPEAPDPKKYQRQKSAFLTLYKNSIEKRARADRCINCGKCLSLCPQNIPISTKMREIDSLVSDLKETRGGETV